jgi:hypothetical protein
MKQAPEKIVCTQHSSLSQKDKSDNKKHFYDF